LKADGDYRWMSARIHVVAESTHSTGVVVALRDVDEQVTARTALAASEAHYREVAK
jgi:hypothetical protein